MRKSRFTEDQVIKVLKEHAAGMSADELCRKYQKSRRAKSALQAMVIDESLLQRMQLVAGRQALDRAYLFSLPWTANIRQERTTSPSMTTVQVPQTPCSQPICVPVCPHSSRMASTRVQRGSKRMT
jgi:hypothetical protein